MKQLSQIGTLGTSEFYASFEIREFDIGFYSKCLEHWIEISPKGIKPVVTRSFTEKELFDTLTRGTVKVLIQGSEKTELSSARLFFSLETLTKEISPLIREKRELDNRYESITIANFGVFEPSGFCWKDFKVQFFN